MLYSESIIEEVRWFLSHYRGKVVVDPVMVATSGACLLKPGAVRALTSHLLPLASVVTPNLPEAERLLGHAIRSAGELRAAAREIYEHFGCAALAKGGHLPKASEAIDCYYSGKEEFTLSAPFIKGISTHGTGCTYAAAIAGYCARGYPLAKAVERAKQYINQAISQSVKVRDYDILNHFSNQPAVGA